jgi:hypothetical protein
MATYYVRQDGTAGNKGAATSDSDPSTSMNVSTYEGETFATTDVVIFSDAAANPYRETVTLKECINQGSGTPTFKGSNLVTGWTPFSGNIWQATLATECEQLWWDGTFGARKTGTGGMTANGDWYWAASVLYFYDDTGDPDTTRTSPGIEADQRNYIFEKTSGSGACVVDGMTIEHSKMFPMWFQHVENVTIKNCDVSWGWLNGIAFNVGSGDMDGIVIEDNVVSKCGTNGITITSGAGTSLSGCIIRRNECSWMSYYHEASPWWETGDGGHEYPAGIKVFFGGSAVVSGVEIYDNYVHDIGGSIQQKGNGIWCDFIYSSSAANGTKIYRNWIEDTYKNGVFLECTSHVKTFNNVIVGCGIATTSESAGIRLDCRGSSDSEYNLTYNNTIYGGRYGVWAQSYAQTGCQMSYNEFKNNIVTGQTVFSWSLDYGSDNRESSDYVEGTTGWKGTGNIYSHNCTPSSITLADITSQGVTSPLSTWEAFAAKVDPDNHLPTGLDYNGGTVPVDGTGGYWWGNGWTQSGNSNVRYVMVRGAKSALDPDSNNIYVRLYDDNSDEPGSILATATLNVNDFLTDSDVHVFDFGSNQTLSDGNKYYLIVEGSWSHDNTRCFNLDYRATGAPTGNTWWSWRGSYWQLEDTSNDYGAIVGLTGSHDPTACNEVEADPLLTTPGSGDFTLQSGSPCRDAGTEIGADYDDGLDPTDNSAASWPSSVSTLDQDEHGGGWEVGAYVYEDFSGTVVTCTLGQVTLSSYTVTFPTGEVVIHINSPGRVVLTAWKAKIRRKIQGWKGWKAWGGWRT